MYVAQPEVKPGCVFRRSNISLLEKKKLVTDKEVRANPACPRRKCIQSGLLDSG